MTPTGNDTTFRVYLSPPSPASSSSRAATISAGNPQNEKGKDKGSYLVCHHGAGSSGLSFACLAKRIKEIEPELGVLAYDARGHGELYALQVIKARQGSGCRVVIPRHFIADHINYRQNEISSFDRDRAFPFKAQIRFDWNPKAYLPGSRDISFFCGKSSAWVLLCQSLTTSQLMGHSMGAAPIVSACPELQAAGYKVSGVVVLDVVEGLSASIQYLPKVG